MALAEAGEFVAVSLDAHGLHLRLEPEATGDAVVEEGNVLVLELDDAVAVEADEMVVLGFVEEVRIVVGLVAPEVDDAEEVDFGEEGQGAVDGGAGDGPVEFAGAVQEFVRVEVIVGGEGGLDDGLALFGAAKALTGQVIFQALSHSWVHY
mgnify:CR=1 FL=1